MGDKKRDEEEKEEEKIGDDKEGQKDVGVDGLEKEEIWDDKS